VRHRRRYQCVLRFDYCRYPRPQSF